MTAPAIVARAHTHANHIAIIDGERQFSYAELLDTSARVASGLLDGGTDLAEQGIAFLIPASFAYAATQWGIWRAGGMAVPLSAASAEPELEYALTHSQAAVLVTVPALQSRLLPLCQRLGLPLRLFDELAGTTEVTLPSISPKQRALMLFTSGTTSKPKGVVSTHSTIEAQITSLVEAWEWSHADRIPLFLPLHHVHGIINVLSCALWSGARVETFTSFDALRMLNLCTQGRYTVFMAVPTIYFKLLQSFDEASDEQRRRWREGLATLRLMVSGSAALPASVHQRWQQLTGHTLLERYGMTEIGMALSHPLHGERRPGAVGIALPGVEVRLVDESGKVITEAGTPGEIQVRGPTVFLEYWQQPEATRTSFQNDWFKTGDVAVVEDGQYRILGRVSVDIIKSGGYKLSALEIEAVLLEHPDIAECAVVGVADDTWGEAVAAVVVPRAEQSLDLAALRHWCGERMAKYKLPKRLQVVTSLPRNAMGKVTKPAVKQMFQEGD